jgi:hypothetical protein
MNYMKFDLGKLNSGKHVEVSLSGAVANVWLLNHTEMYNYEHGRASKSIGGLVEKSPVRFIIDNHDHWYVVVDKKGIAGVEEKTNASVKVL